MQSFLSEQSHSLETRARTQAPDLCCKENIFQPKLIFIHHLHGKILRALRLIACVVGLYHIENQEQQALPHSAAHLITSKSIKINCKC